MIEINLLPEELKTGSKPVTGKAPGLQLEKIKKILRYVPAAAAIVVALQIILGVVNMMQAAELRILNKKWADQGNQKKILEKFNKEYAILSEDAAQAAQLVKSRLDWAPKLYALSKDLPAGVWVNELTANSTNFSLQGSVLSPQGKEMALINDFLEGLKQDKAFYGDFDNLELGSVQKRAAGAYNVEDFSLTGTLKNK